MDKEKMDFLMTMGESEAEKLSISERYDRIRLLRQRIGMEAVKSLKTFTTYPSPEKAPPRSSNADLTVFKDWTNRY